MQARIIYNQMSSPAANNARAQNSTSQQPAQAPHTCHTRVLAACQSGNTAKSNTWPRQQQAHCNPFPTPTPHLGGPKPNSSCCLSSTSSLRLHVSLVKPSHQLVASVHNTPLWRGTPPPPPPRTAASTPLCRWQKKAIRRDSHDNKLHQKNIKGR